METIKPEQAILLLTTFSAKVIVMTTIYFVRHGQTDNKENINYGRMPGFSLDESGRSQAEKAAHYFVDKNITQIYTSPLERTFQTADIIGKSSPNAKISHTFDLNESESTYWQGLKAEELFLNDAYEKFVNDANAQIGTENLTQMAKRMKNFVTEVLRKHQGENIVCVSHEFPILTLKLTLENKPLESVKTYHLSTGSIIAFNFDEQGNFVSQESVTSA